MAKLDRQTREIIIFLIPWGIVGVTVGTLTNYSFVSTTIAFMVGGFIGSLMLKLLYKK